MLDIFWVLLVPLIVGLVLTTFRAIASQEQISLQTSLDVALDMTFLSLGAAGGAFHNRKVQLLLGTSSSDWTVILLLNDLVVAAILLYRRRFMTIKTMEQVRVNLLLGTYACAAVAVVVYLGA